MVPPSEVHPDCDEQESDQDGSHTLGRRRSEQLVRSDSEERNGITGDRRDVLGEHGPYRWVRGHHDVLQHVPLEFARLVPKLTNRLEERDGVERHRDSQDRVDGDE